MREVFPGHLKSIESVMDKLISAPNPKKKTTRVLKTDIPPPPSGTSTPGTSRWASVAPTPTSKPLLPVGGTLASTPRPLTPQ